VAAHERPELVGDEACAADVEPAPWALGAAVGSKMADGFAAVPDRQYEARGEAAGAQLGYSERVGGGVAGQQPGGADRQAGSGGEPYLVGVQLAGE
jgi:hypothetical protein